MSRAREIFFALVLASISIPAFAADRPPQFVAIAFDNCTELSRWKEMLEFSERLNEKNQTIHFTFFVSGVNFLANNKRDLYQGPHQRLGYSMINFGGSKEDVAERVRYITQLHDTGHEIASHAVGHFDGKHWSSADWSDEFRRYNDLVDYVAGNNDLPASAGMVFPAKEIVGFRAPYLSTSAGLYPALKAAGFRYDTSGTAPSDRWPEKKDGLWRFDLAELRLYRSKKATLSMDYNFLISQTQGLDVSARRAKDRDEMLETYLDYFKRNYYGNRAPLHIGHHFTAYHGGAYQEALLSFVERVCGLPEVQCITYSKLADFMDGLSEETRQAYQKGDFPRANNPLILFDTPAAGLR